MAELEGRTVEVRWGCAWHAPQRFRLLQARPDIGLVKLGKEVSCGDSAAADRWEFWVEIDAIRELP